MNRDLISTPSAARPRRPGQGGFTLVEVMVAIVVLVLALLGHLVTVSAAHRNALAVEEKGIALGVLDKFLERIKSDTDWSGLWGRLRTRTAESAGDTALTRLGADPNLTAYPLSTYYADLTVTDTTVPAALGTVTILVQVPVFFNNGVPELREDMSAPRYGLPADLNGDGVIDSNNHAADTHCIPIVVHLRWQRKPGVSTEVVVPTWLRGDE